MFRRESWIIGLLIALFGISAIVSVMVFPKRSTGLASRFERPAIGVISINGPIDSSEGNVFSSGGLNSTLDQIEQFKNTPHVKALILRINSPGGTVGASQEIFRELIRYRNITKNPIIVSIADIGASGAYWVSLAGDIIIANPGSMVGSIGVIMTSPDFHEIPKRYGVGMRTLKSGKYKDMLSSWRDSSPDELTLMQTMLDDVHNQFIDTLISRRRIPTADAKELAQGQVFSGRQAVDLKLIDQLGGFSDAIALAKNKAHLPENTELIQNESTGVEQFLSHYIGSKIGSLLSGIGATPSTPKLQ
ncbi:signal peptide peptidase SppA [bacterium]|nr:signal peptide peptidase SppA [bacterium]